MARNAAPAIAVAALAALVTGANPVLLVRPSDHTFADVPAFHHAVRVSLNAMALTIGIKHNFDNS